MDARGGRGGAVNQQDPAEQGDGDDREHGGRQPLGGGCQIGDHRRPDRGTEPFQRHQPAPVAAQVGQRRVCAGEPVVGDDLDHDRAHQCARPAEQDGQRNAVAEHVDQRDHRAERREQRQPGAGAEIFHPAGQQQARDGFARAFLPVSFRQFACELRHVRAPPAPVVAARGGNTMVHRAFTTSLRQAPTTCRKPAKYNPFRQRKGPAGLLRRGQCCALKLVRLIRRPWLPR